MALKPGFENQRQIYLLSALAAIILIAGGYEIYDNFFNSPTPPRPIPVATPRPLPPGQTSAQASTQPGQPASASSTAPDAEKLSSVSNAGLDPTLHLSKLILAEQVQYAGSGRNIFSADSAPVVIPKNIAPSPAPAKQRSRSTSTPARRPHPSRPPSTSSTLAILSPKTSL